MIGLIICFISIVCFSLNTVSAANITINDTSTGGINGALSSANSSDTIILQPGLYQGSNNTGLQISKNITIMGNGSPDQVKIDANFINQIFTTNGPSLNITFINITFMNSLGGAIVDYQSGKVTLNNCNFTGHTSGAITMGYNSDFEIFNSTFSNNSANAGGAINNNGGTLNIFDSIFINNSAGTVGGAINNNNGHSNITNTTFIGNNASSDGGAIHISGAVDTNIISSYFYNNTAISGVGGAIFSNAGNTNVTRSDFVNNTDGYGDGGAMGLDGGNVILNYNRFYNNNATPGGYQVYFGSGTINADRNWWGDNDRAYYKTNSGIVNLTNYVVVDVEYDGPEIGNTSSRFNYTIRLSDNTTFDPSLLPYFTLDVGTGPNPVLIPTWDARENQTVIVNVPPFSTMVTFGVDDWRKVFWANGTEIINLTVTKVANVTGEVTEGQIINYTITVTNYGPSNATNVVLNEILPAALIYQDSVPSVGTYDPITGIWSIGDLANGDTVTLVITVQINGTGLITNGVNVTADQTNINNDTNGSN
ncbi:DUF11 domain-containing protein, partial [Methanobrevibacter sp. TMH8]|nr:DUF11 domain-containing protein [Methanobrevibacter sp. TMH8]